MCTVLAYESVRGSCSAYKRKRSLGLRNTVEWEEIFFLYMKQVILYVHEGAVTSWREENIVTLRPEMGNIFLCITVQDFLDSMVICIFRQKITQNELLRI